MSALKKIIFLSNNEKDKGMAILQLEKQQSNIFGTIKTYSQKYEGDYILGIKTNEKIIKQNVNIHNNIYSFVITEKLSLENIQGCTILKKESNTITPLLWYNEKNQNHKSTILNSLKESIQKLSKTKIAQTDTNEILLKNISDKNHFEDNKILNHPLPQSAHYQHYQQLNHLTNDTINKDVYSPIKCENSNTISHCQISLEPEKIDDNYIEEIAVATSQARLFETDENEVEKLIDNEISSSEFGEHKFYNMIEDQLNELFERYPKEENLCNLIENSKWVKIDSDNDNKYYVVGVIHYNNDIKYICYGVPGQYNNEPPTEMRDYSQWLPTDVRDPYSNGYWVMYQDADTGENIFIN